MPEKERLPRDAFHIDPGLKESIEAETEARLEETKAELAWASEKAALGLQKMEETFLTSSAVEAMELKALGDAQLKVSSFRTTELADWQKEAMEQVHIETRLGHAPHPTPHTSHPTSPPTGARADRGGTGARRVGEAGERGGRLLSGGGGRRGGRERAAGGGGVDGRQRAQAEQGRRAHRPPPSAREAVDRVQRAEARRAVRGDASRTSRRTYTRTPPHTQLTFPAPLPTGTRTPPTSRRSRTRGSTWETSR
jgi:hypothetical protein